MKTAPEIAIEIFRAIPDPRVERTKVHSLERILFIALCTCLSGGEGFYGMQACAQAREAWLCATVGIQSVPSHDTFNRVFQAISPECFGECLIELSRRLREKISGDVVALDGKTHRRTGNGSGAALHMLNAWSVENRVEKKADYVLAVQGNHPVMHEEIKRSVDALARSTPAGFETVEKDHGRTETRRTWQSEDISWFEDRQSWDGLRSFCLVEAVREHAGHRETSRRYTPSAVCLATKRKWRVASVGIGR
jgi:hypothetical protein